MLYSHHWLTLRRCDLSLLVRLCITAVLLLRGLLAKPVRRPRGSHVLS